MKSPGKLLLFLFFSFLSMCYAVEGQETDTHPFQGGIGFHGGPNASFSSSEVYPTESNTRPGYQFAVYGRFMFPFYIQPEIGWYQTFSRFSIAGVEDRLIVNSMQASVLVGYHFLDIEKLNVRLQSGPMLNFVFNSKWKDGSLSVPAPDTKEFYANPTLNWRFGAGLNISRFTVDLYYDLGIIQIYKTGAAPGNTRNNSIALSFGFFFDRD